MSLSVSSNESNSWNKRQGNQQSKRPVFASDKPSLNARIATQSVRADQARFSGHLTESEDLTASEHSQTKTETPQAKKPTYGKHENNLREAARIVLCDIAPLALSFLPLVGIPGVGVLFALASLPMSYVSGKLGRKISKNVDAETLNPVFKYVHQVRNAITQPGKGQNGNVVDLINKATDDLLNVHNMPALLSAKLLPLLKVNPEGKVAALLKKMNSMAIMRAEINTRLANADNGKEAGKAMYAGVKDFAIYGAMSKMGAVMEGSSVPGFKMLGAFLKNAAWVKIAADLVNSKDKKHAKEQTA